MEQLLLQSVKQHAQGWRARKVVTKNPVMKIKALLILMTKDGGHLDEFLL